MLPFNLFVIWYFPTGRSRSFRLWIWELWRDWSIRQRNETEKYNLGIVECSASNYWLQMFIGSLFKEMYLCSELRIVVLLLWSSLDRVGDLPLDHWDFWGAFLVAAWANWKTWKQFSPAPFSLLDLHLFFLQVLSGPEIQWLSSTFVPSKQLCAGAELRFHTNSFCLYSCRQPVSCLWIILWALDSVMWMTAACLQKTSPQ